MHVATSPRLAIAPAQTGLSPRAWLVLSYLAVSLIWGSTFFAMGTAMESLPPFLMAGLRFSLAGLILYVVLRIRGLPAPTWAQWGGSAVMGVSMLAIGNGMVAYGQQWVSSSLAAVMVSTMPLWAAVFAALGGQRPGKLEWLGLGAGFGGLVLLNFSGDITATSPMALLIVLGPMGFAFGSMKSRTLCLPTGWMRVASPMLVGGPVLLIASRVRGEAVPTEISVQSALALAYLVIAGSLVAFAAYTFLLKNAQPAVATSYAYVNPIVAIGIGVGFAGESLTARTAIAMAIILSAVMLISISAGRRARRL